MPAGNPLAHMAFLANDIDGSGIKAINNRISAVADDMGYLGIDVVWVSTLSPSIEMINNPALALYVENARPRSDDSFLYKPGATVMTDQNHRFLNGRGKTHLVIAGYHSTACTFQTIKHALALGYDVTFLADCTNYVSMDPEKKINHLSRRFPSTYELGEEPYTELLRRYPSPAHTNRFRLMTHMEFFRDIRHQTGMISRLLGLSEATIKPDPNRPKNWTYIYK